MTGGTKKNIVIIGGGVVGLSCAVKISEFYGNHINVTIISEHLSPNTTGDGAAGLWGPYLVGSTPVEKIRKWSKETHDFFHYLWKTGKANEVGICLLPIIRLTTAEDSQIISWKGIVYGYNDVSKIQLERYSKEHSLNYTNGIQFVTYACQTTLLLPYLFKRFLNAGGHFVQQRIHSIDSLVNDTQINYDIIINCTGIEAKYLMKDNLIHPIRGQIVRVQAPWLFSVLLNEDHYIIPNCDSVILGGTHQYNDYNQTLSIQDSDFIFKGCENIAPCIKNANVIKEWVGLRPGRSSIRLEEEEIESKQGKNVKIIHNYGHGGCGVTLAWGCATDVLEMVNNIINDNNSINKSKL